MISAGQDSRVQLYDLREKAHIHTFDKHVSSIEDKNVFLIIMIHNRPVHTNNQTCGFSSKLESCPSLGFTQTAAGVFAAR